jgi:hypothetical protein
VYDKIKKKVTIKDVSVPEKARIELDFSSKLLKSMDIKNGCPCKWISCKIVGALSIQSFLTVSMGNVSCIKSLGKVLNVRFPGWEQPI